MTGLLETIVRDLRSERLDETVLQTKEYGQAMNCVQETYAKLLEKLPYESKQLLDEYTEQLNMAAAIYDQQAYQQGMKDFMIFLLDLLR